MKQKNLWEKYYLKGWIELGCSIPQSFLAELIILAWVWELKRDLRVIRDYKRQQRKRSSISFWTFFCNLWAIYKFHIKFITSAPFVTTGSLQFQQRLSSTSRLTGGPHSIRTGATWLLIRSSRLPHSRFLSQQSTSGNWIEIGHKLTTLHGSWHWILLTWLIRRCEPGPARRFGAGGSLLGSGLGFLIGLREEEEEARWQERGSGCCLGLPSVAMEVIR